MGVDKGHTEVSMMWSDGDESWRKWGSTIKMEPASFSTFVHSPVFTSQNLTVESKDPLMTVSP